MWTLYVSGSHGLCTASLTKLQFFYLDAHDLRAPVTEGESTVGMLKKDKDKKLHRDLVSDFAELPKLRKLDMDDFSIVNVAPAIVPNPYMPGIRVWGYNVTGWENQTAVTLKNPDREHRHRHPDKERCKRAEDKKKWWCKMPKREWYSDADAPSRKNGLWSPLGYAQVQCQIYLKWCALADDCRLLLLLFLHSCRALNCSSGYQTCGLTERDPQSGSWSMRRTRMYMIRERRTGGGRYQRGWCLS